MLLLASLLTSVSPKLEVDKGARHWYDVNCIYY